MPRRILALAELLTVSNFVTAGQNFIRSILRDPSMAVRLGAFLAMFIAFSATAESAFRELTLEEAIELAIKQNKEIAIARLSIDKADAQVNEAFGNALPTVSLSASYNRNIQLPVFFITTEGGQVQSLQIGADNNYVMGAQASQILFNSAVFTGIGAANIYADGAREQYKAAVAKVVTEVKRLYYGALAARQYVNIAEATLTNAQQSYETVNALFKEGMVAEYDNIRANVAVENVRPQVTEARAGYNNAVSALATYLAISLVDSIEVVSGQLDDLKPLPEEAVAIKSAMENNYELKALEYQLQVLDAIVDVNRATYYPSLTLIGNWQNQGVKNDELSVWNSVSTSFVGLNFQFNIFNGLRTIAKVEQAQVDYLTAQQQYQNMENIVQLQVRTSVNNLRSALERIDAQRSTVEQAQRGLDIARIRYTEGTGNLLEINDAEVALARAQVNRLQALLDYYTRRAEYERVVGEVPPRYLQIQEN